MLTIKQQLSNFVNIGIDDKITNFDKIRIRILNSLILLIIIFQLTIWIQEFLYLDFQGIKILSFHLAFSLLLVYLSSKKYFRLSAVLLNLLYPAALFGLVFIYLPPNNLEYIFIVFIFTSILITRKIWEKTLLISVNMGFYLFTQSDHPSIGYLQQEINTANNFFLFIMTIGTFLIILQILLNELKEYEQANKKLIVTLEEQNKKLININEELERFTYAVSHDMKTPLRAINSFITVIERKLPKEDFEILRYFEYVKGGTKQLHQLIMDSLNYAKLSQDEIILKPLSINEMLFELIRDFSTDNVEIYTDTFPDVCSNSTLLRKLFQNIIENGIKYNDSEIKIINITYQQKGKNLIFEIKDNGIGIDKNYHDQIFDMYKRLNKKSKYKGTGLGLSICKKIARQIKGDIWVESELGKGSSFFIKLPEKV